MNSITVMICDDNIAVHESISTYLKAANIDTISAYDGESALQTFRSRDDIDLIILDIMLPRMFGTEVCTEIRKKSDVPIIMLSARGDEPDKIIGLQLGADDYITKPFSPREVVARVQTILRRTHPSSNQKSKKLTFHDLEIDVDAYIVTLGGKKIDLTSKEVDTLSLFVQNAGMVLSREKILNSIWGYDFFGDTRAVDTHVSRLRQKLHKSGANFNIATVYGVGYRLDED